MKETIMEFKCWLRLVLSGGNPPSTPDKKISIFFVRCILSMCVPKKRNSESPAGSPDFKISEALVSLCAQSAARSGDFNISERVSYLSTLWHVQNHAQVHLSCTWTGYGHLSAISEFFLFGNFLPNFNLKNLIWNLHKGFFHEINCQNLLLIKKWASHAWYGTLGMAISLPMELTFPLYNFLCKTICALAVGLWWPSLLVEVGLRAQNTIWNFRVPCGIISNTFKVRFFFPCCLSFTALELFCHNYMENP